MGLAAMRGGDRDAIHDQFLAVVVAPEAGLDLPLFVVERDDLVNRVRGHRLAMRVWATAGADLLLGGHIHQSFVAPLTAPMDGCWVVQTGTAVSRRVRERVPNSVHLIRWSGDGQRPRVSVERWDWYCELQFQRVAVTPLSGEAGAVTSTGQPAA